MNLQLENDYLLKLIRGQRRKECSQLEKKLCYEIAALAFNDTPSRSLVTDFRSFPILGKTFVQEIIDTAAVDNINMHNAAQRLYQKFVNEWNQLNQADLARSRMRYANRQREMNSEDNKSFFHERTDSRYAWLNEKNISQFMPPSTNNFAVLAPVDADALGVHYDHIHQLLDNNPKMSIVIPVGPGHWRAVQVTGGIDQAFNVTIYDSFGVESAENIKEKVIQSLELTERDRINFDSPRITQSNGHSCGDYVVSYINKAAINHGVSDVDKNLASEIHNASEYRKILVNKSVQQSQAAGLSNKAPQTQNKLLGPFIETKSNATNTKVEKTVKLKQEKIMYYEAGKEFLVDKNEQIRRDSELAKKLDNDLNNTNSNDEAVARALQEEEDAAAARRFSRK